MFPTTYMVITIPISHLSYIKTNVHWCRYDTRLKLPVLALQLLQEYLQIQAQHNSIMQLESMPAYFKV